MEICEPCITDKKGETANILPNGNMWGGSGRSGGKAEVAQENKLLLLIEKGNRDLEQMVDTIYNMLTKYCKQKYCYW